MNLVKIEDLLVGDEILYPSGSKLIRARITRPIATKDMSGGWHTPGKVYYKQVRCEVETETIVTTHQYHNKTHTSKRKIHKHTGNYNGTTYVNLNDRDIYLLNRKVYD